MLMLSVVYGVGAALTLDEFALILHLEDVYWTKEGRSSVEATMMGAAFGILCFLATAPLGNNPGSDLPHWVASGVLIVDMAFGVIAFLKGKAKMGTFGIFIPGVAIFAALRLATPDSPWSHRFYSRAKIERSRARAKMREGRYMHIRHRIYDVIGGAPHLERAWKRHS
jgi:hypothetical protein